MSNDRRYDEREVGLILRRVTELHEYEGDKADSRSMTKREIEEVVAELGISKALVARAASELAVPDSRNRPVWWLGGKTDLMFEEVVAGTIDEAVLTQMFEVLRREFGDPGEVKSEGGARTWLTTRRTTRRVHFSVVEHADGTTLRLEERMPGDARTTVGGGAFAGFFTGFLTVIPLKALLAKSVMMLALGPVAVTGASVGWLAGRALWKRKSRSREEQLRTAFGQILGLAESRPRALLSSPD